MITHSTFDKAFVDEFQRQRGTTIVLEGRESLVAELGDKRLEIKDGVVYLDFSNVDVVNSLELSALIRFRLRMVKLGKSLRVCNVGPALLEIFEITRFPPRESFVDQKGRIRPPANQRPVPKKQQKKGDFVNVVRGR